MALVDTSRRGPRTGAGGLPDAGRLGMKRMRGAAFGQELVELALLIPLLFMVATGVLDLGRLFHAYITITNSAREGARFGTFSPTDNPGIIATTKAEAANSGIEITDSMIAVSCPGGCSSGLPVRVTIDYPFKLLIGFVFPNLDLTLNSVAEMMVP